MEKHRIIYYYQTFTDLSCILIKNTPVTHIMLSSFHFGTNPDKSSYIHLNNYPPTNSIFDKVWKQLEIAKEEYDIKIHIMLGGAGGAFQDLFENFETYYPLLLKTIFLHPIITGINLDIEEPISLENIKMLIDCLKRDLGETFIISMAPIQGSLQEDNPGMGGFVYKDLYESKEGRQIDFFNTQFYFDLSSSCYDQCIQNGYLENQIVLGMITDQDFNGACQTVRDLTEKYENFGGVYMWEFFNSPPGGTKNPGLWAQKMKQILDQNECHDYEENKKLYWFQELYLYFINYIKTFTIV
tara:strand:+ start:4646 stop:5539 length:894 start_codon:yes stop_codon:yes gene_type:complete